MKTEDVLERIPQELPFRFLDEILELNSEGIKATYRFRQNEYFYQGHFPGNPVTPGVILLEACAQAGLVAYGLYLASEGKDPSSFQLSLMVFTEANVEFTGIVRPGEQIWISARKIYFRHMKLKVEVDCTSASGKSVLRGTLAGMGVKKI